MSRQPDPDLEQRIFDAALKLWHKGGEGALTLRAIAKVAGTNTPAIYRRFRNRRDIVLALAQRAQMDLTRTLQTARSPEQVYIRYVEFASSRPHEYKLLHASAASFSRMGGSVFWNATAMLESFRKQLVERLGGRAEDHTRLSLVLCALAQGSAELLVSEVRHTLPFEELQSASAAAVDTLLASPAFSIHR